MPQTPVLGIDLGTTNSLVACFDDFGNVKVLRDPKTRSPLLRSVVAFSPEGIVDVGEEAVRLSEQNPDLVVYSVKRLMGVAPQDVGTDLQRFAQAVVADDKVVRLSVLGRDYSAPEISAAILKRLRQRAEDYLETTVTQAVITVPAYFDEAQRQATKDAARLAGLEVMRLVNEPTAAALAYGLNTKKQGIVAVYDLGGGTFDISILKLEDGIFEVLSTAGETHLGGDDFDMRLAEKTLESQGIQLTDKKDRFRARRAGEACKKLLSTEDEATFSLVLEDGRSIQTTVTRAQFDAWCHDLLARTGTCCQQALKDANISSSALSAVVLVGGSTRMPMIRGYVQGLFGQAPRTDVDPDEVVALGAAIQANILAGGDQTVLLLDVTPLSLGIETMGGVVANLIPRNSTIPISAQNVFTTHIDGQTSVNIHVLQGERDLARDCRSLARFTLTGIPPMPAAIPRIEVTFQLDADGLLQVMAREERSGVEAKVEVKPSYGLSEEEIEAMLIASFDHAEEDVSQRMLVEARVEAESILSATEKSLAEDGEILLSTEERSEIAGKVRALQAAAQRSDADAVRQAVSALDAATQEYAQRRMNRAIQIALGGKDISELGGTLELSIPVQARRGH